MEVLAVMGFVFGMGGEIALPGLGKTN